jgi:hypothetical protein
MPSPYMAGATYAITETVLGRGDRVDPEELDGVGGGNRILL